MQLTTDDIQKLIFIGRPNETPDMDAILYFKNRNFINRLHWVAWRQHSTTLDDTDLVNLFKGLVIIERELKWTGGSVAGAIWVYRVIQERRLDNDNEIADFGLRNCDNPWVPFGSSYYGNRTAKDYFSFREEKAKIKVVKADRYDKVLRRVEGRKEKRVEAIAELRKLSKEQRGEILKNLLEKYSTSTTKQRLEIIADDLKYPPEYYPLEWINLTTEEIQKLPIELIKKLYDKLSTKTKGQWKRFAHELEKLDDGV
jgi:hypothetical protein